MNKCKCCNKDTNNKVFCSNKCQQSHRKQLLKEDFLKGKYVGKPVFFRTGEWTKELIIETYGYKCCVCEISEWNDKPLTLEVDHIDGKAHNNTIENLRLICPNCHSQSSNFRAKNIGNSDRKYLSYR